MGCHFFLQGIFPTQGLNLGLLHCRQTLYHLNHLRPPVNSSLSLLFTAMFQLFLRYVSYWNYEKLFFRHDGAALEASTGEGRSPLITEKFWFSWQERRVSRFGESTLVTAKQEWKAGWVNEEGGSWALWTISRERRFLLQNGCQHSLHCELSFELGWRRKNLLRKSYLKKNMEEMVGQGGLFYKITVFYSLHFINEGKALHF